MKILLVGEYSTFHKNLRDGLRKKGYIVDLASGKDGWKQLDYADIELYTERNNEGIIGIYKNVLSSYANFKILRGYDIIQFINPMIYFPVFNVDLISRILKLNKGSLVSLVSVGADYALLKAYRNGEFEYYIEDYESLSPYSARFPRSLFYIYSDKFLLNKCDVIIPGAYEYSVGYKGNPKVVNPIPMPIDTDNIKYEQNVVNSKIIFFHGINREKAKGTRFIREALYKIQKEFPEDVDVIIDGHMPYSKYVEFLKKANVVIDQCSCYGYGMNALIAMSMGKVVVAGARKEMLDAYGIENSPVIHAQPSVEQLVDAFRFIIKNKNKISEWGKKSREYVERFHDCKVIADKYMNIWKEKYSMFKSKSIDNV